MWIVRHESGSATTGVALALAAYGIWGVAPLYWKALERLPAAELLAQRVVWSCLVGALLVTLTGSWRALGSVLASPRRLAVIATSAVLIGTNWLVFLWAVLHAQVLATSLGYYLTPLLNVLLGMLVLRERLRPIQALAVLLAAAGMLRLGIALGGLPWVALVLASSFGIYGLVRKLAPVEPVVGFGLETLLLAPAAGAFLAWLHWRGEAHFPSADPGLDLLVLASGAFTAAPLICFTAAARRLRLVTLGFFQYIAPSLAFAIAVLWLDEPFTPARAFAFGCVWVALALYSLDSLRAVRLGGRAR